MRATAALIASVAAVALVPSTAAAQTASKCPAADVQPVDVATSAQAAVSTICLVNEQRAAAGLKPLKAQVTLALVAQRYAQQMASRKFFDHVSPSGSTLSTRVAATPYLKGVRSWGLAENIAWGGGSLSTPRNIVSSWMKSPGHRRNILDGSLRELGVGVAPAAPLAGVQGPAATYVHDFGRRR